MKFQLKCHIVKSKFKESILFFLICIFVNILEQCITDFGSHTHYAYVKQESQ